MTATKGARRTVVVGSLVGTLVGLVVLGPALAPGYTLHYDLVFVPDLPLSARTLGTDGSVPRAVPNDLVVALLGDDDGVAGRGGRRGAHEGPAEGDRGGDEEQHRHRPGDAEPTQRLVGSPQGAGGAVGVAGGHRQRGPAGDRHTRVADDAALAALAIEELRRWGLRGKTWGA